MLLKFKKELYYKIYCPTNIYKCTKEEYIEDEKSKKFYDEIKSTTIEDFKPNGRKRTDLIVMIPLLKEMAANNEEFKNDVNNYLSSIKYDEEQINEEINLQFKKIFDKSKK